MEDLIRRSDAIKAIDDKVNGSDNRLWLREIILELPSADRPQGEWVAVSCFEAFGGDEDAWIAHGNPIAFHYCSECKEQTRIDEFGEEILSNYCPNCGCRMKGADDE